MEITLFPSLHYWYCYLTKCSLQESGKGFRNFKKKKSTVKKEGSARAKRGSSTANKASSSSTAKRSSGAKRKRWDKEVGWWSIFFFHNREEVTVISCFALCISSLKNTKDYATVACFPLSMWTHYNLRSKPLFVKVILRTGTFGPCGGDGYDMPSLGVWGSAMQMGSSMDESMGDKVGRRTCLADLRFQSWHPGY